MLSHSVEPRESGGRSHAVEVALSKILAAIGLLASGFGACGSGCGDNTPSGNSYGGSGGSTLVGNGTGAYLSTSNVSSEHGPNGSNGSSGHGGSGGAMAACDGVQAVPSWTLSMTYEYSVSGPVGSAFAQVDHKADVTAMLTPMSPSGDIVEWSGPLMGNLMAKEHSEDATSIPIAIADMVGDGPPVITSDPQTSSIITLTLEPSTCTFQFTLSTYLQVTLTSNIAPTAVADMPIGVLQKGITPLGDWRSKGLGEGQSDFPAYSVAFIPTGVDAYIPYGAFAQGFWDPPNADPFGHAQVVYSLQPNLL